MKSKRFLLVILAIALVFGMTVVGCDKEEEGEDPSVNTRVVITDVPSNQKDANFTMTLIYAGDSRTIATENGVIKENGTSPNYTYTANAEFEWKWKGDMTTKPGTGTGFDSDRLYISGRITLKIGSETKTANSDVMVGSVHGMGGLGTITLKYTDFN